MATIETDLNQQTALQPNILVCKSSDGNQALRVGGEKIKLEYDITGTMKTFEIDKNGVVWTDGVDTHTTGLERLALVQTAFQAVELPPNSTTLKLNNTLLLDDGTNNALIGIDGSGNLLIDPSNNLTIGSGSSLTLQPTNNLSTSAVPYGLNINSPSIKTYPTTANFNSYPAYYTNLELGTSQTINSGLNFVYGDYRNYTKSAGTTSDIESLYFNAFQQNFSWTNANTCKQYIGFSDNFTYSGKDFNGRTSSSLNANNISLICPTLSSQTITNITAREGITIRATNSDCSYNITNSIASTIRFLGSATNVIATITNHSFIENSAFWDATWTGAGSMATITNMYGLRLNPPFGGTTTGLTITNNWGIYSGWSSAKNYFAGNVGIGTTTINNALDVVGDATISNSLSCPLIQNTGGTIEINATQINLDATTIDLQNTSTTTSVANHTAEIKSTTNGLQSNTFLKVKLNGADIWIPYFTTNPSL
jgi:hypothetical protein